MKGLLLMLCTSIGLTLASASAQAHTPDRKVHATEFVDSVAIAHQVAVPTADSVCHLVATESTPAGLAQSAPAYCVCHRIGTAAAVAASPSSTDSLSGKKGAGQLTEPKRQLRPDPGRHRKGYNYR